ncbi:MAG: tRNA pseudouridine(13) synthase TruD [Phycisphaera sp.]|nr:MAG: tRNA pseudouridine(13) synthase TruD [Phycisphaera sp.]
MPPEPPPVATTNSIPERAYRSEGVPGIGGVLKQREDDFLVDELPLYQPSGQGEHLMLFVEKRGLSSSYMVGLLARHFGVRDGDIGYAGLKDKLAITRQHVTVHVPGKTPEDFPSLQDERVSILWADLHDRKMRRGHLAGNGFSIRVRQVNPQGVLQAHRVLGILEAKGMANRVGEQRFGQWGTNHLIGRALVRGEAQEACDLLLGPTPHAHIDDARVAYAEGDFAEALHATPLSAQGERRVLDALVQGQSPKRAIQRLGRTETGFMVSALQSAMFNAVLHERMRAGTLDTLMEGDVAVVHGSTRTTFVVSAEEAGSPEMAERLAKIEVSPTGPMWGPSMRWARGETAEAEKAVLERFGITLEDLERFAKKNRGAMDGDRRPLRVPLRYPQVEGGADAHGTYVRCGFELPKGSYATEAMAEVMKPDRVPAT